MDSLIEPSSLAGIAPDTISISNVNLSLGSGAARVHILKDVSLRVASGEAIGLIGPSGSGKSTLLMVMAGLERPDSGEVVVDGTPFNALDEDALARFRGRQVGIVFQSFHLIPTMTALENVAVPLELAGNPDATRRAAQELTSVGLGDRLHHYPTQLSGGEQQRVALARALAPDPAILVADEPTGNLDEATGKQIVDLLFTKHAERGMTLVLVTHDASLARRCDRVGCCGRVDLRFYFSGFVVSTRGSMRRQRRVAQGPAAQSRPASWRKIVRSGHAVGRKTRMRAAPSITRAAILIRRRRSVANSATESSERFAIALRMVSMSQ